MPELTLVLLEPEVVVDAFVDEALEVIGATEELIDAVAEETALDGVLEPFVEDPTLVPGVAEETALELREATEELIDAVAEETALDGVLEPFVDDPTLVAGVDGVVEAAADTESDEEPSAARAGTAVPARARKYLSFILIRLFNEGLIWDSCEGTGLVVSCSQNRLKMELHDQEK